MIFMDEKILKNMIETEFKVLMHCGEYVDANLLNMGVYATTYRPFIYPKDYTIETMCNAGLLMKDMAGNNFISESYFENLRKCELVPISINFIK